MFSTVVLSSLILCRVNNNRVLLNPVFRVAGKMSYSIFVWHQLVLAFIRYFYDTQFTIVVTSLYLIIVGVLSWMTYKYVEQKAWNISRTLLTCGLVCILTTLSALYIYVHAGVVRDVPELNIKDTNVHRGMHGEYCDRVYEYDKPFPENEKENVLCIGNSFARDMGNILLESKYADSINLSYIFTVDSLDADRIRKADVILIFGSKKDVNDIVWKNTKKSCAVWGISTKHYGVCNGNIYRHRYEGYYTSLTAPLYYKVKDLNSKWASEWGRNFINLMSVASDNDNQIKLFTDDGKLISQDCYHLTQGGAKWYAKQLDIKKILKSNE